MPGKRQAESTSGAKKRKTPASSANTAKRVKTANVMVQLNEASEAIPNMTASPNENVASCRVASHPCLFCLNPIAFLNTNGDFKMHKNLCKQMMKQVNPPAKVPSEIGMEMFPFCNSCEQLVERLWKYQEILEEAQSKISEITTTIQRLVVDVVVLNLDVSSAFSTSSAVVPNKQPFVKLRDVIVEGYRSKLRTEMGFPQEVNKNHHFNENVVEDDKVVASEKDDGTLFKNGMKPEMKMVEKPSQTASGRQLDGVLAIDDSDFEIYRTSDGDTGWAYLECSKCPQAVPYPDTDAKRMERAYHKMKTHSLLMHSHEGKLLFHSETCKHFPYSSYYYLNGFKFC